MSLMKQLGSETAIYGVSSILARVINALLQIFIYTRLFASEDYGVVVLLYPIVAVFTVILKGGLDTAFFRFAATGDEGTKTRTFHTAFNALLASSAVFLLVVLLSRNAIVGWLEYPPEESLYVVCLAVVLFFDVLSEIPFARLRLEKRPIVFAAIRVGNIVLTLLLNILLLIVLPFGKFDGSWAQFWENPDVWIGYVFLANMVASTATFIALWLYFRQRQIRLFKWTWDQPFLRQMLVYALPLVLVGLAGSINESFDRVLLKSLLPGAPEAVDSQLGIYGACYKLTMIVALFTQAYRYAAEPFFFSQAKSADAKTNYRDATALFAGVSAGAVLFVLLFLDQVKLLIGEEYWVGLGIVPIVLAANWFLGLYYNLSVWYKLTDQTKIGAYISIFGAALTILLNWIFIPQYGYWASAWATLACYGAMTLVSYALGQKYYPVQYRLGYYLLLIISVVAVAYLHYLLVLDRDFSLFTQTLINGSLLLCWGAFIAWRLKRILKS